MPPDGKIQTKQTTPCGGKRERVCNARDQCNWIPAVFGSGKTKSMGKCVKKEVVEEEEEVSELGWRETTNVPRVRVYLSGERTFIISDERIMGIRV